MAKVITTELQHSGASGANITLDSSKNVTCENNLTVDGTSTLTGAVTLPDNTITNAKVADDAIGVAELSATGTASASTFLRGDNAWATPGGGKVLQWVAGRYTNDRESTTDTSNFVAMADGLSITPTAASSRILMMVTLSINEDTSGNTWLDFGRTISGGSISRLSGLTNGLTSYSTPTGFITLNMSYVDHPNTTTSTLYQVMIKAGAGTVALNDYSTTTGSSMTLLELAG
jgi:hypothetical protein